ncbi:hypothetical protein PORUE0001_1278 [Porphyromonas uenonis 60-3]|uniref:Fimbrial subunit protein C-terminal domain-containing protein n=1 Tax=Porphyromonas uenonis 60-3 TaxID=596327 RepID=C2MCG3_9PORP|nr:hypothetical protein [Porphyromonas uenonis]EEK16534.1 hypothetical protein PORUE0001_1278 [Porphyromonas uenonis 60-3]
MRSRIQNILLLLASMLLTVVATTSCNNSPKESDQERTLIIKLSSSGSFRAVEEGAKENSYTVDTYTPITLFFYDAQGEPTEPYRVELKSNEDIRKARSADGYEMEVREAVSKVSAVAGVPGIIKPSELDDRKIYSLQGLSGAEAQKDGFLYKVPYVAPKTPVQQDPADQNKLTVTLQPVPNVARLEISGNIEVPFESTQPAVDYIIEKFMKRYSDDQTNYSWLPTPQDVTLRTIGEVTIRGIYVNNYKETPNVDNAHRTRLTDEDWKNGQWTGHNAAMHTLFEGASYATAMNKKQVDAYQIYPGGTTADKAEALDHIIVKVEYKVHTQVGHFNYKVYNKGQQKDVYACTGVEDRGEQTLTRFITIRKFLVTEGGTDNSLVSFDPGKIYRIDLSYLSSLFSTNAKPGIKNTNEITEVTPRPEGTDERPEETTNTIPVSVVDWIHININTELD